ncbi:enoyl-CoA hydratase/isomerase family protein [Arthrobacter sp. I2-34]|uniref:Enoyl-CoA hydratase/isomerase family protein n=1 Tax=Arthrobacter hankyongi TaxID=2904801 RepID=A0ABS9L9M0_9MICC|nr:enoyl-CoA hydratase/isomerase family protein [Arthrobacter hankyongi]MCG2623387.1 enoyl-CoA hydratase/isomerase family protein [Arthrobacter hankyongi]
MDGILAGTQEESCAGVVRLNWASARSRNAIGAAEAGGLAARLDHHAVLGSTAVVVLGLGQAPFCSGWNLRDLDELRGATVEETRAFFDHGRRLLDAVSNCPQPVIAVVAGAALGFGCSLLSRCDLVLAADDAVFGVPEIRHGFAPATVIPELLATLGPRETAAWALTGDPVPAARAASAGLVHRTFAPRDLESAALELARTMARYEPGALRGTKRLIRDAEDLPRQERRALGVQAAMAGFGGRGQ